MKYSRILLKISGESLMGPTKYGQDLQTIQNIADDIIFLHKQNIEICIVVGGGNIFRGIAGEKAGMDRSTGDYIGMLATVMNALAVQNILEKKQVSTRVLSAIPMTSICEKYIRRKAIRHMEKGRVVVFAAGTGNPFFSTDTAAALRANEMNCQAILKATKVDGVYSEDPKNNPQAKFYPHLTYQQVLEQNLKVMDSAAISLSRDSSIPIYIFSIEEKNCFFNVLNGTSKHTIIS